MKATIRIDNKYSKLYRKLCQEFFGIFMREAFKVLNPCASIQETWHIELLCHYLQHVKSGNIKRLIINIPPRSLKSTIVSICWSAWMMGNDPSKRIICSSYSKELSTKLSIETRHLMTSEFFQYVFPDLQLTKDENRKTKFLTTERGFRFSTSVGGTITGEGGDILILDDPHNALDVNSDKKRKKSINWFQQSFLSRLDDKENGAVIVVMQRLHKQDLTGFLMEEQEENWKLLRVPLLAKEDISYQLYNFHYLFKKGSILNEKRNTKESINQIKREIGSFNFNAQYLQDPILLDAGMIKRSCLMYFSAPISTTNYKSIVQSWDTAIKSGDGNSYSVCTTWGESNSGDYYLLDVYRDRIEYPALKNKVIELGDKWNVDKILIEEKANGHSLIQDLKKQEYFYPIVPIKVLHDKITRFSRVSTLFEYNRIFIDEDAAWRDDYEEELFTFPNSTHDDQIDSTSQYLHYILDTPKAQPRIRQL